MSPAVKGSAMLFNVMMFKEKVVTTVEVWGQKSEHYWHKKASDWTVQPKCEREREREKERGGRGTPNGLPAFYSRSTADGTTGRKERRGSVCLFECVCFIYIYVCVCVCMCVDVCVRN